MYWIVYLFIISYFLLGAAGFYFINRNKPRDVARKSWTKFIAYFLIIHILFFSIIFNSVYFQGLAILIIGTGLFELIRVFREKGAKMDLFFAGSILVYVILALGFYSFSGLPKDLILFTFLILSIFDAFSQISGQMFGKIKIAPSISPNKTVGGTVGGTLVAMLSAYALSDLTGENLSSTLILAAGIVVAAFGGDLLASFYKRRFGIKDYSHLIPGHGGFLDRFDSLIAGGAWVALFLWL